MSRENLIFKGANGQDVFTWCWNAPEKPKGIVQIFHGMAEHAERYDDFAGFLNMNGFTVYACDQRGHGKTGEINKNSCDLDDDGFIGTMKDQKLLSELIRGNHAGVPLFVLAHSFGSFIAQEYIKHYGSEIDGLVLSGTCKMEGPAIHAGCAIAALSSVFGKKRPGALLDKLSFGSFNKGIQNAASKFAWISRDEEQVKKYEADNFCGNIMSANFFYYFFKGLKQLYRNMELIPKDLPVYLISGDMDPVGMYGKGVLKLHDCYTQLGISNLQLKLFPGCRHEIINELNRQEVYKDILSWLKMHV